MRAPSRPSAHRARPTPTTRLHTELANRDTQAATGATAATGSSSGTDVHADGVTALRTHPAWAGVLEQQKTNPAVLIAMCPAGSSTQGRPG